MPPRTYMKIATVGDIDIFELSGSPNGSLEARIGSLAVDKTGLTGPWKNVDGSTAWKDTSALGGDPVFVADPNGPSIQSQIDAAIAAGHTSQSSQAIVLVKPGAYTEDITAAPFIGLVGLGTFIGALINGKITIDMPAGSQTLLQNINVVNTSDHALEITGSDQNQIFINECSFSSDTAAAVRMDNTGAGTQALVGSTQVSVDSGSSTPALEVAAGQWAQTTGTIGHSTTGDSVEVSGTGAIIVSNLTITGRIHCTAGFNVIGVSLINASGQPSIECTGAGSAIVNRSTMSTDTSPAMQNNGAGSLFFGVVTYLQGGIGAGGTGTVSPQIVDVGFVTTTPASWGGVGVPNSLRDAVDRLAAFVASFHGVIP